MQIAGPDQTTLHSPSGGHRCRALSLRSWPLCGAIFLIALLPTALAQAAAAAQSPVPSSCSGPSEMLALLDRPTVSDSSCIVPQGSTVVEAGINDGGVLGPPGGTFYTYPFLELRYGLTPQTEVLWLPPNYQYERIDAGRGQRASTLQGFGPTTVGIKHEFGYSGDWQWTGEVLATPASGSSLFGSDGIGAAVNGIVTYGVGQFGASLMLGVTTQAEPSAVGGQRFESVNPDLALTWLQTPKLQFYAEAYGQSHEGYRQGWGWDADGGIQYMITPSFEVDAEEGVRLQGGLGGFNNYTGVGVGLIF